MIRFRLSLSAFLLAFMTAAAALAQSVPGPPINLTCNMLTGANCTVWTPLQWQTGWQAKVDVLNGTLTNPTITGGTLNGTIGGNPILSGLPVFNGGATLNGIVYGSPTFSGSPVFSGGTTFSASALFSGAGISTVVTNSMSVGQDMHVTRDIFVGSLGSSAGYVRFYNSSSGSLSIEPPGTTIVGNLNLIIPTPSSSIDIFALLGSPQTFSAAETFSSTVTMSGLPTSCSGIGGSKQLANVAGVATIC